jgi:hypothetical protein
MARVWVPREHAEAEIEKARREGYEKGLQGNIYREPIERARADERERIRKEYERLRSTHMPQDAAKIAMGEPIQEPKPLEKLPKTIPTSTALECVIFDKIDEIVNKVNALDAVNVEIQKSLAEIAKWKGSRL